MAPRRQNRLLPIVQKTPNDRLWAVWPGTKDRHKWKWTKMRGDLAALVLERAVAAERKKPSGTCTRRNKNVCTLGMQERLREYILETGGIFHENCDNYRASSGMGREAARQLADRFSGLQEVWLIARRMDRMQELERTLPIPARCFAIDLTDASQRETLENELAVRKPNVKILVNASGFGKIGTVGNLPLDDETGMVNSTARRCARSRIWCFPI